MHNNYYFLRQVAQALNREIRGSTLVSCFSQTKDELIIEFNDAHKSFFIRAILQPEFSCITFPIRFNRARKNSVDLFNDLLMQKVTGVRQFTNERSLAIEFGTGLLLIFKMHGTRANVLLVANGVVTNVFRSNLEQDLVLQPATLDREIDWSKEHFFQHTRELRKTYFTFGPLPWLYLEQQGFATSDKEQQWIFFTQLLQLFDAPEYFITEHQGKILLSLLPIGEIRSTWKDPLQAATEFAQLQSAEGAFRKEKHQLITYWNTKIQSGESYLIKTKSRLNELTTDRYKLFGDLLMANMHQVPPRAEVVRLQNFSGEGEVEIKLDAKLSPQKNAERFYRKARNQQLEIKRLNEQLDRRSKELEQARLAKEEAEQLSELKDVRKAAEPIGVAEKLEAITLPYREHEFNGYRIWVGKDAKTNDELTLKYATKDDLWLHARDVAGSHVVIKHEGKPIPKPVIERAASLAAFYSKRKNESLCPVIVTPKKFVRKRKGDPPGAVVVEREEVILVEPRG